MGFKNGNVSEEPTMLREAHMATFIVNLEDCMVSYFLVISDNLAFPILVFTSPIYRIRSFAPCSIGVRFMVPVKTSNDYGNRQQSKSRIR